MNILNPKFKYTPSVATDLRRTFARERLRLRRAKALESTEVLLFKAKKEAQK